MSLLSANTLFHFTRYERLMSILENGFYPSYSKEAYYECIEAHVPMVCFCDIPISNLQNHLGIYGKFGIGLTKAWGMEKGLNPVLYMQPKSLTVGRAAIMTVLAGLFAALSNHTISVELSDNPKITTKKKDGFAKPDISGQFLNHVLFNEFGPLVKQYQGKEFRGKQDYIYYDEKEWRYIPPLFEGQEFEKMQHIVRMDFKSDEEQMIANQSLRAYKLEFTPADIKYIILESDSDVERWRNDIKAINGRTGHYSQEVLDVLTTRIITCQQMREDF